MFIGSVFDDGRVVISGDKDIKQIMLGISMIIGAVNDCDELSESDRELFRHYVREELGRIVFMSEKELEAENNKMRHKVESAKNEVNALKKVLRDAMKSMLEDE